MRQACKDSKHTENACCSCVSLLGILLQCHASSDPTLSTLKTASSYNQFQGVGACRLFKLERFLHMTLLSWMLQLFSIRWDWNCNKEMACWHNECGMLMISKETITALVRRHAGITWALPWACFQFQRNHDNSVDTSAS